MSLVKHFGVSHAAIEQVGTELEVDGSLVALIVEGGTGFHVNMQSFPGMIIRANRTATDINFEWRFEGSTWFAFASSLGVFTVADSVSCNITAIDPSGTGNV